LLEEYEEEVLRRMFDQKIIGEAGYARIQHIEGRIKWPEIQARYQVKKKFKAIMRRLSNKGLITFRKGGEAYSLSKFGVDYVIGKNV
jgi:hypothetical protein